MAKWNCGLIGFSLLVTVLGMSACTPRDVQVMSDQERAQLNQKKADRGTPKGSAAGPGKEDLVLAAHLVERQAEGLQMLLWVIDSASFNKSKDPSQQVLESLVKGNGRTQHFKFTNSKKDYLNYKSTLSGAIQAQVSLVGGENSELAQVQVESLGFATFLQATNSKDTLQAIDEQRTLTAAPIQGAVNEFNVVYATKTRLKINRAGSVDERTLYPLVEMHVTIDWVNKKIELLSSVGNIRSYDRFMEQNISSEDLKITFDSCAKIDGNILIKGKGTGEMKVEDTAFSTLTWSSAAAGCEQRPTLDWRRFLEN